MNTQRQNEILQEIISLCALHEKITHSSDCREFNRRAAFLLQVLEDEGYARLADRAMYLLANCSPKELSQCDSIQRAKDALEKLRDQARESLEKGKN
jgi:hypothetical protein